MTQENSLAHTHWTYKQNQEDEDQPLVLNSVWQRPIRKLARAKRLDDGIRGLGKIAHDGPPPPSKSSAPWLCGPGQIGFRDNRLA